MSQCDCSTEGHNINFYKEKQKIIPKIFLCSSYLDTSFKVFLSTDCLYHGVEATYFGKFLQETFLHLPLSLCNIICVMPLENCS